MSKQITAVLLSILLLATTACSVLKPVKIDGEKTRKLGIKDTEYKVYMSDTTGKIQATYTGENKYGVIIVEKTDSSKNVDDVNKNTYILDKDKPEILGFTYGNGNYKLKICDYTGSRELKLQEEYNVSVTINSEIKPFEGLGYYTNYDSELDSIISQIDYSNKSEFVESAYRYITTNINYNNKLANLVLTDNIDVYKPILSDILKNREGICIDQASLLASLCRKNGIPAKVAIGYNEINSYHAWVEVYLDGKWLIYDSTLKRTYKDEIVKSYVVKKYY